MRGQWTPTGPWRWPRGPRVRRSAGTLESSASVRLSPARGVRRARSASGAGPRRERTWHAAGISIDATLPHAHDPAATLDLDETRCAATPLERAAIKRSGCAPASSRRQYAAPTESPAAWHVPRRPRRCGPSAARTPARRPRRRRKQPLRYTTPTHVFRLRSRRHGGANGRDDCVDRRPAGARLAPYRADRTRRRRVHEGSTFIPSGCRLPAGAVPAATSPRDRPQPSAAGSRGSSRGSPGIRGLSTRLQTSSAWSRRQWPSSSNSTVSSRRSATRLVRARGQGMRGRYRRARNGSS